jgi:hypothetical protein
VDGSGKAEKPVISTREQAPDLSHNCGPIGRLLLDCEVSPLPILNSFHSALHELGSKVDVGTGREPLKRGSQQLSLDRRECEAHWVGLKLRTECGDHASGNLPAR